jgi:hypothetical protein
MPLFKKENTSIFFVHIPKTAGGSIEHAFLENKWHTEFLHKPQKNESDIRPCNPQHYHAEFLDSIFEQTGPFTFSFTVVRHPFTRLISEAMWKSIPIRRHVTKHGFDNTFYQLLSKFLGAVYSEFTKAEANWLSDKKLFLDTNQRFPYDNHVRPQHEFLMKDVEIFRYETINETLFPKLKQEFGVDVNVKKHKFAEGNERPVKMINASDTFKQQYLSLYKQDHDTLGYELPW